MFRLWGVVPAEGPVGGKRVLDRPADILVDERLRLRRRRWYLLWAPWPVLSGRLALFLVVGFVFAGVGVAVCSSGGEGDYPVPVGARGPHGMAAHVPLSVSEVARASSYGEALFRGPGGLPVVRFPSGELVRELTPVEWEYESPLPYISSGSGSVVWGPGPRGWGMWWEPSGSPAGEVGELGFDAEGWRHRQEMEVRWAVAVVTSGLRTVGEFRSRPWRVGPAESLQDTMVLVRDRHGVPPGGAWSSVPLRWACLSGLEHDLHQGVTQGCASPEP